MNEIKNNWKKWLYWFVLGVALICIYKILDNYENVMGTLNTFFGVISPFLIGIFIAYLLYMPSRKFEELYGKVKIKALPLSFISKGTIEEQEKRLNVEPIDAYNDFLDFIKDENN